MCGIVGYIGEAECCPILLSGLSLLEYRGYDSAGISYLENGDIHTIKTMGKIRDLEQLVEKEKIASSIGIGHTRWATHGKPSTINAHPHTVGSWSIVHNGIIENELELKKHCHTPFLSSTDSELFARLLDESKTEDNLTSLINITQKVKGSYALACLHKGENRIYLAKRKNPLYVAQNRTGSTISSDISVFYGEYEDYFTLEDDEYAIITNERLYFYNKEGLEIVKASTPLQVSKVSISKDPYPYYMEKEMHEIPQVLEKTLQYYKSTPSPLLSIPWYQYKNIHLIGCGTAYHAGCLGALYFERYGNVGSKVSIASEFRYVYPHLSHDTLYILISQSGETADTLACCEMLKEEGYDTLAITNVPHSRLSQIATYVLPTLCGAEISVASTKVYNTQVYLLYLLAKYSRIKYATPEKLDEEEPLPITIPKIDKDIISLIDSKEKVIFVGKGEDYITSHEASLKLKEITYLNSIALPCGELKHGSIALIDENSVVVAICTKETYIPKISNCISEIKARGGSIILVTNFDTTLFPEADFVLSYPLVEEEKSAITSIIPLQMLAYQVALHKKCNPDQPRNLAKSVTVE